VEFLAGDDSLTTTAGTQPVSLEAFFPQAATAPEAQAGAPDQPASPTPQSPTAVYTNYAGNTVIGAFAPLTVAGLDWGLLVEQSVAEAFAPARGLALAIFIAGLIVLGLIGLVSFFTARGISRPVRALESAMERSAAGDDRVRAEVVGNDELARLAETFNRMTAERGRTHRRTTQDNDRLQSNIEELLVVAAEASDGKLGVRARVTEGQLGNIASALNIMLENVANFIEQIRVASGRVASASVEIATSSGDLTQGVSDQTQQIDQTNEQLRALSDQSDRVVSVTESAADAAEETRLAAARGADAVEEMGRSMAQIREKVQVNAQKIKRLGERSMEISGIVKSISDISAQTDMLAFNASVESERGAEGRGFSMVADRVRDLAERTKQATAEIERLVSGIQNETAEAVLQMEKMTEEVERGTSKVRAANHSLEEIVGAGNKSSDLVEEIRNIAGSQRQEARGVLEAMVTLSEIAERAEQKVQQNRHTSEQLADLSSDLNAQISEFDTESDPPEEPGTPARLVTS
jgi:twitching motility protein PilJ